MRSFVKFSYLDALLWVGALWLVYALSPYCRGGMHPR